MSLPASAFVEGSLAHRFRALWDSAAEDGEEWPDVFAWLAGHPTAVPPEVVDVLLVDFHNRFRREGPLPPERYLDAYPALARDPDLVMQLVGGELQARRERGESVDVAQFASRFPRWREGIIGWFAPAAKAAVKPGRDAEFGEEVPRGKGADRPRKKKIPLLGWGALGILLIAGSAQAWLAIQARGYERLSPTPLDIQVIAPDGWLAGSRAAVGLRVSDGVTGEPRPGIPLQLALYGADGKELAKAESPGAEAGVGMRWVPIEVPDAPGRGTLRVISAGAGGEPEVLEVPVTVRRAGKLMISTDKPIYRPGEAIRLRGLALREPDLKPLSERPATFRVLDSKGNVIFRREGPTSRHGIASAECPLAAEAMTGTYTLRMAVGELEGEAKVQVEPYELPKIEVALAPDKAAVAPGGPIAGTVRARYIFGKPVAGATVRIWSPAGGEAVEVRTGEDGSARFEWPGVPASGDATSLELMARVQDSAGQRQDTRAVVALASQALRVETWPDGEFVPGLSNIVYVRVARPDGRPVAANVVATGSLAIAAGADGLATFELTEVPATGLFLRATAEDGAAAQATFLPPPSAATAKLLVDRVLVTAGEPLAATLRRTADAPEAVAVEAVREGQVIAAASLGIVRKEASATLAIPEGVSGRVTLVARAWGGAPIATRPIEVVSPRRLSVKASWDRPEYRPGEPARLQFLVADAEGRPAPGALSVAMVDRAVELALKSAGAEAPPAIGREATYFRPDALGGLGGDDAARERLARAELARSVAPAGPASTQIVSLYSRKSAEVEAERSEGLRRVELRSRQLGYSLGVALAAFAVVAAILWVSTLRPAVRAAIFASAATAVLLFCLLSTTRIDREGARTAGGIAKSEVPALEPMSEAPPPPGAMLFGMEAREKADEEPRLRKDFPETLLWRPELVTDDQGHASIELGLADSITTWKLMAGAVSAEGGLGGMESELRVFQPFQVDLNLPRTLTRGDRVDVPVVVYNFLDRPQVVSVTLDGEGLERVERAVELGPNEVRSVSYPLRAERVGKIALRAKGVAQEASDAIERTVEVVPDGRLVEQIANGILREPAAVDFAVPADTVPGSTRLLVKLYPTAFSQVMDGLDGIFAMPHGCFEQTSATTYPNLLALDYLKRTGTARPDVETKARGYVLLGYQRLLTFEVDGGGFDWFGRAPANRILTAYGLMEFRDMARVADVDPQLIVRTRDWLMQQRRPDGSWEPESHGIREGVNTYTDGDQAPLRATAYIAWSIWDGDPNPRDAGPTLAYLTKAPAGSLDDPYTLALMANALLAMDPSGDSARPYARRLAGLRKPPGQGGAPWEFPAPVGAVGDGRTIFFGAGESRAVETAALGALALIRAKEDAGASAEVLEWLVARRGPGGTWGSTQATVLALKALLAGTGAPLGDGGRAVELALDDGAPRRIEIPADQSDVVRTIDLGDGLAPGPHRLALADVAKGGTTYQVISRHHVPEGGTEAPRPDPLRINLAYGKTDLKVFEEVTAKARVENPSDAPAPMAIARLPMPPGFALEGIDAPPEVEKAETAPDAVTLYLRELPPGKAVEVSYRLRPTMPMAVAVPAARVYEYYDPERGGSGGAARLVVAE